MPMPITAIDRPASCRIICEAIGVVVVRPVMVTGHELANVRMPSTATVAKTTRKVRTSKRPRAHDTPAAPAPENRNSTTSTLTPMASASGTT